MALSWNEIKDRAIRFSKEWDGEISEQAEAKSFWDQFFDIFGISRRKIASFERPVLRLDDSTGYIDLLWKGTIMVEHKSRGKDLDKAYKQALDYFPGLKDYELPKYILVSDFARFRLYNLDEDTHSEFELKELYKNVKEFGFIAGYQKHVFRDHDPVNIRAAELMGKLHDRLKVVGYTGHPLELYLVRLLFCLFAEDTSIFERDQFRDYLEGKTKEDGSDLAHHLATLFYLLNTPLDKRLTNLDEELNAFPYVNGKLFEESLPPASFDRNMRAILLECNTLDWGKISPAIFGSLFQSVMNPVERRNLGAHYTSEKNIMKVIKPLFLDDLWKEFESAKQNRNKLLQFHDKLASLRFLDPACGCGNFLVISYREIRLLELEIIKILQKGQQVFDISELIRLDVDRFYGIEIEEFPSQIAQVAMWLMDHQMNMKFSEEFGQYYLRLPLRKSPNIHCGNALRLDWQSLIDPIPWEKKEQRFDYIYGNPPFVGAMILSKDQRTDIEYVFSGKIKGFGILDLVTAWYLRAAEYQQTSGNTKCAFVSTNSITQGEQVGILWRILFQTYQIKIFFAHRTFRWDNEAKGKAAVHVVIIGFCVNFENEKRIFEYEDLKGEPHEVYAQRISPYLIDGKIVFLQNRNIPICSVPKMSFGSMPRDGGNLIFSEAEKESLLQKEPAAGKWIRKYIGSQEFINGLHRYCLWLVGISPFELKSLPEVLKRIEAVRNFRLKSTAASTRKFAATPYLFCQIAQPSSDYLLFPGVSSERRKYIPIGFQRKDDIANNLVFTIPDSANFHLGILSSEMHMAWVKYVCGRLESRFRYSKDIVYNNFPWPENPSEKQKKEVEDAAQKVLDTRAEFPGSSLADLYDPLTMPPALVKAHQELDKAVDLCYRPQPFPSEAKRIEFLFELYDKYTADLFTKEKPRRNRKI
ncbi:MAG: DNA methyltransferase [Bacteroidota bacterium]